MSIKALHIKCISYCRIYNTTIPLGGSTSSTNLGAISKFLNSAMLSNPFLTSTPPNPRVVKVEWKLPIFWSLTYTSASPPRLSDSLRECQPLADRETQERLPTSFKIPLSTKPCASLVHAGLSYL